MYDDETEGCLLFIFIILFIVINIFMWKSDTNVSIMNITEEVDIERTEYKPSSTTLIPSNINGMLVMKTITNPEKYNIEVEYNGKNYILNNKDKYYLLIMI